MAREHCVGNMKRLAVLVAVSVLGAGCAHTPKGDSAGGPEVVTYDAEISDQTLSAIFIGLPWELQGGSKVESISWIMNIEGEPEQQGTATPDSPTSGTLLVEGALSTSDEAFEARKDKSALTYSILATFVVADSEDFEADWHGEIFPSKRPEVAAKPQAARYGSTLEINFTLIITNPNPFTLASDSMDYKILLDGTELTAGTVAQATKLSNGSETQFDIQQQVGGGELPELAKKLKGKKIIPYQIDIVLKAGGLELATTLTGEIEFSR